MEERFRCDGIFNGELDTKGEGEHWNSNGDVSWMSSSIDEDFPTEVREIGLSWIKENFAYTPFYLNRK